MIHVEQKTSEWSKSLEKMRKKELWGGPSTKQRPSLGNKNIKIA
jgi:hypothetical protein